MSNTPLLYLYIMYCYILRCLLNIPFTLYFSPSNPLINTIIIGTDITAANTNDIGFAISIPNTPVKCSSTITIGTNNNPFCIQAKKVALALLPMLWKVILAIVDVGNKSIDTHINLRATTPTASTSLSFLNTLTISGATIKHITLSTATTAVENFHVNNISSFTLPYFFAP